MDEPRLRQLLDDVSQGVLPADDAVRQLKRLPFADMGFAKLDHHRQLRQALPEAIYGPGKTPEQCSSIVGEMLNHGDGPVLLSRVSEAQAAASLVAHPSGERHGNTIVWRPGPERSGRIAVLTAGTADLPVADECLTTLTALGFRPRLVTDVGVAGLHRLLPSLEVLEHLDLAIVIAGMEGALASIVGGITAAPVIAVPTSVGYGAALEGVTALLAMLSSCAAGVTVVGIDNGFGAACAAARLMGTVGHRTSPGDGL